MVDKLKIVFASAVGILGSTISSAFGGWDDSMKALILFMALDYVTGLMVACFNKSPKTQNGGLSSKIGYKGLAKKSFVLIFIVVSVWLDRILGIDWVRNAVIIGFISNELVSIIENGGLLGVPIPKSIVEVVEILKKRGDGDDGKN